MMTLTDLGWSSHFAAQMPRQTSPSATPLRIAQVHRDRLTGLGPEGPQPLSTPPDLPTGAFAVGDWVLAEAGRVLRRLERISVLQRRAAGTGAETQLIAANVDTLFVVSACTADLNVARLERYLALAHEAGCFPVVVLTRADTHPDPESLRRGTERALRGQVVLALDARAPEAAEQLLGWCRPGQTAALVGSSGVGKTTLSNALTGQGGATQDIREDDAKGRHTTTARGLARMTNGGWLIDTPGMRALRLMEAQEGIGQVFDDIADLAAACRFSDCSHGTEPGCAVQAAIAGGTLDPARLARYDKLERENAHNSATVAEARQRQKAFGKMVREVMAHKRRGRGD